MTEWFNQYFLQRWTSNKVYLFIHYWHWYWASFVHLGCHNNNKIHFEQIYLTGMKIILILLFFYKKLFFPFPFSHFFFFSCLHKATTSFFCSLKLWHPILKSYIRADCLPYVGFLVGSKFIDRNGTLAVCSIVVYSCNQVYHYISSSWKVGFYFILSLVWTTEKEILFCTSEKLFGSPDYTRRKPLFYCLHRKHKNSLDWFFKLTAGRNQPFTWKIHPVHFCARAARSKKYGWLLTVPNTSRQS